jgi:hypothetical protein
MIGACKPTVSLLDDAVDVLSKDNSNPWCPTVVRNDTTPSSVSTLPRRRGRIIAPRPIRLFNPDAIVSVEPTSINRPVTGRSSVVRTDTWSQQHSSIQWLMDLLVHARNITNAVETQNLPVAHIFCKYVKTS